MFKLLVLSFLWLSNLQAIAAPTSVNLMACPSNGSEYTCLVCNCYYESSGEPQEGRIAVSKVVLSRVAAAKASVANNARPDFPTTACGVIFQPSQFSWTPGNNTITAKPADRPAVEQVLRECRAAVTLAQTEGANGLIYFYNPRKVTPAWSRTAKSCGRIGDHVFLVPRGKTCPTKLGANAAPSARGTPTKARGQGTSR